MRLSSISSHALRYLLTVLLIAVVTAIFFTMRESLETSIIALLFLLPVGLVTALWGLRPGITAAALAFFTFNYFFIKPYYTLAVHQAGDLVVLMVFLIVAVVISQLVGRAQAGTLAANAREQEATQLYEFSTALAGPHDQRAIARRVAEQVQTMFLTEHVEFHVLRAGPFSLHLPEGVPSAAEAPDLVVPIQTVRDRMGEIRLWRAAPFTPSEKRLLQTFASQSALALERAVLAEAESRAKILEESDRLKSAILSSVSHELRTPLSTIKAAVTSLRSGEVNWDSPARPELLEAIDDESDHLNMLVGNLLDMSRIEAGVLKPQRQWNILSEIVSGVLARMRHRTETHQLHVDVSEDLPLVPVDYIQMEQVFTNLVSNSLKYAPEGTLIQIEARLREDKTLHVKVSNQGPPVPEKDLERIFDKFYRITAADRVTGTGLGLSICKGIIEAHGGQIWAENLPTGFAFNFTLPTTLDGAPPPEPPLDSEMP